MRGVTSIALAALLSPLGASAHPGTVRVVGATRRTVYLDAGAAVGLAEGMVWTARVGEAPVRFRVLSVSSRSAAVEVQAFTDDGRRAAVPRLAAGMPVPLPPGLRPRPPGPGPRPPPPEPLPWISLIADAALPRVRAPTGSDGEVGDRPPGPRLRGEIAVHALAASALDGPTTSSQDVGLSSQLAADLGGGWTWDHILDAHVVASPELPFVPLQAATPRLDVYLARLGYSPRDAPLGFDLGRILAAPSTGAGLVDGGRVRLAANESIELGAWAGLRPRAPDLSLAAQAPTAGLAARFAAGQRPSSEVRAHFDLALGADGWRGSLDRAFLTASGLVATGGLMLDSDLVLDAAEDAEGSTGPRPTRATLGARLRLFGGDVGLRLRGGTVRPVWTASLAEQLPGSSGPGARHAFGLADAEARVLDRVFLVAGAQVDHGDDGIDSVAADVGARIFDLGPVGSYGFLAVRGLENGSVEGIGGEVGYDVPLGEIVHAQASYAVDRWRFVTGEDDWEHRGRLSLDRRFGLRWRSALAIEGAAGAGAARAVAFVLVGFRL